VIMMVSICKGKTENRKFRIGVVNKKLTIKWLHSFRTHQPRLATEVLWVEIHGYYSDWCFSHAWSSRDPSTLIIRYTKTCLGTNEYYTYLFSWNVNDVNDVKAFRVFNLRTGIEAGLASHSNLEFL
jgi:hypothetical protein